MKKRLQTLLIASLTIALLTVNAFAFSDVSKDSWYSNAVDYVNDAGIMVGDDKGNFNPDKPVTRAEMAVVICRTLEATKSEDDYLPIYLRAKNFSDVPASHWANGYINKASFLEIIQGYGNGHFGPSDNVIYEQAVTMMVRVLGKEADAANQGGYPNGFLSIAEGEGLLSGMHASKGDKLSRANVAVLLSNYCHIGSTGNPPSGQNSGNIPEDLITNVTPSEDIGIDIETPPIQDNQSGNFLEIDGSQQEERPESGPETGENGGGT